MKKILIILLTFLAFDEASADEMAATIKNNKSCKFVQDVYPLKKYKPHKAFALSFDGKHCGYSYSQATRDEAKRLAMDECLKLSKRCNLLRLD